MSSSNRVRLALHRIRHALRAVRASRRAVSAIEFGVVLPVIAAIILGTYDLGNLVQSQLKLSDALHAGGLYAMSYPTAFGGMQTAVTAALPATWTDVTVPLPTARCACWTAGAEATADCSANPICPSGSINERFVTLTASRPITPLLLVNFTSVNALYVARVQ